MEFREADPGDAPAIRRVARRSWHEAYDEIIGAQAVEEKIDEWYGVPTLEESIERADSPMIVAVEEDVIGFAQGGPSDGGPASASLWRIYLLPEFWGDGLGGTLLELVFDELRADGHDDVWLSVMADNSVGRAFYQKHGFEIQERQTTELAGQEITDLVLRREL